MFADDRIRDYRPASLRKDFISGITVGIVAIPLGMAFAMASGVKPEYGIYTTIIAGFIVSLLGGSRFQIAGPTGAFIPILLAVVLQYGYENLLIAGLMSGVILVIMSFFKHGSLVHFIPKSVTIGFTTGIAVIIFTGQLGNFFGLDELERKEYFHQNMAELFRHLDQINGYSIFDSPYWPSRHCLGPKVFPAGSRFARRAHHSHFMRLLLLSCPSGNDRYGFWRNTAVTPKILFSGNYLK